jgi:hypothetical protein
MSNPTQLTQKLWNYRNLLEGAEAAAWVAAAKFFCSIFLL